MRYNNIIKHQLNESVKLGKKEIAETLKNSHQYQMGVEYEFIPNYDDMEDISRHLEYIENLLDDNDIPYDKVENEHDNMVEVVTTEMSIIDGLKHIKRMFELGSNNKFQYENFSGMHISISHERYHSKPINLTKFLVLMSAGYLHSIFPERKYVESVERAMIEAIRGNFDIDDKFNANDIESTIENSEEVNEKYITIKISDYVDSSGRLELRFFGGKDYGKRYNEIRWQLLRSIYILSIAYDSDMYSKEYQTALYKLFDKALNINTDPVVALKEYDDISYYVETFFLTQPTETRKNLVAILNNIKKIDIGNVRRLLVELPRYKELERFQNIINRIYIAVVEYVLDAGDTSTIIDIVKIYPEDKLNKEMSKQISDMLTDYINNNSISSTSLAEFYDYVDDNGEIADKLIDKADSMIDVIKVVLADADGRYELFIRYLKTKKLDDKEMQMFSRFDRSDNLVKLYQYVIDSDIDDTLKADIISKAKGTFELARYNYVNIDHAHDEDKLYIKFIHILSMFNSGSFKTRYDVDEFWDIYQDDIKEVIADQDDIGFAFAKYVTDNYSDKLTDSEKEKLQSNMKLN